VLFSKWLSVILVLMITLFVGVIISLIIQILSNVLVFDGSVALEVLLFLFFSFLLIALMTCIGILCSVLSSSSNVSLLYALTLWLLFSLVIPNTSVLWADKLFGIEHSDAVAKNASAKKQDIDQSYPEGKWSSDGRNPFMPEHKLRANMQMDFVMSDKKIYDAYFQSMFGQYEKSRAITNISPISLFECSMEGITYGGYLRFRQNWEDLHIYQQQFLSFFKQVDAKDKESPHWYNPWEDYSTTKKPVKFEEVPLYKETKPSFSSRFQHIAFYGGLLIIYTFLVFVITFQRFVKSDVR